MVGDYISREAVLDYLYRTADGYSYIEVPTADAVNTIKAIPAVDVVEMVHASWIEDGYYNEPCVCSNCGEPGKPEWRFCTNCGAKIDGGQDE